MLFETKKKVNHILREIDGEQNIRNVKKEYKASFKKSISPKIKEFMYLPYQVNLAISLHAPNNEIRNKIMPINKAYSLDVLMPALKTYLKKTNRRLTFEYILLKDIM